MSFWHKFPQRRILSFENIKNRYHHGILYIRISLITKFRLKLSKKCIFSLKDKWTLTLNSVYSSYPKWQILLWTIFEVLGQICPKRVFPVKNRKSGHDHQVQIFLPTRDISSLKLKKTTKKRTNEKIKDTIKINAYSNSRTDSFAFLEKICLKRGISSLKQIKLILPLNSAYLNYSRYQISA